MVQLPRREPLMLQMSAVAAEVRSTVLDSSSAVVSLLVAINVAALAAASYWNAAANSLGKRDSNQSIDQSSYASCSR